MEIWQAIILGAVQGFAEFFQGVHGNTLIALQVGDGVCAKAHFVNQCIRCNASILHRAPQRRIANHRHPPHFLISSTFII